MPGLVRRLEPEAVEFLRCPRSGERLQTNSIERAGDGIVHGILHGGGAEYPIVFGVAVFKEDIAERLLPALKREDLTGLREQLLTELETLPEILDLAEQPFVELSARVLERIQAGAEQGFSVDDTREWLLQLQHWHRTTKYLNLLPYSQALAGIEARRLVDLGCGVGHLAQQVARLCRPRDVLVLDANLAQLLTSPWITSGAGRTTLACSDLEEPLPIVSRSFDLVACCDVLHYIERKTTTLGGMRQIMTDDALVFLWHLHNAAAPEPEPAQGMSMTPGQWCELLSNGLPRVGLYADEELTRSLVDQGRDWAPARDSTLPAARSLSAVAGDLSRLERVPAASWFDRPGESSEIVNPIYTIHAHRSGVRLELGLLSDYFEAEFDAPTLPRCLELSSQDLDDPGLPAALRRAGILIDVPVTIHGAAATGWDALRVSGRAKR